MGKFVMKETKNGGVKFDLKAGNGEVIATSEAYSGDAACKKGIESVRKNAVEAKLEDQTVEGFETVTNPKFEVYTDKAGEFLPPQGPQWRDHRHLRGLQGQGQLPQWH